MKQPYLCDKCGKEIEQILPIGGFNGYHHPFINVYSRHGFTLDECENGITGAKFHGPDGFRVDLCDECFMQLRDWLGFTDEKEKGRWM